jgi:predicted ATPase
MRAALVRHDALVEALVTEHGGVVVRPRGEGDSRFAVFARATDAVAAAAALHRALHAEPWPPETPLWVRLALHTGEADLRDGDYYGSAVNRAARLRAIAHGGQALLSQATHDLARDALPPEVGLQDLGEHRLADLARPERVFQLLAAGAPADFPPLRSLDALPHNLPVQLTSFVGREREQATVRALLGRHRLVTLTGPGGTGKTRLALHLAAELLDAYPDGVWLVELAALADPALVPQEVATAVGVREEPGRPLAATLTDALKPQRRLLVLDNCEHLLDACARLADALLRACPRVTVLATSREALGIAGEVVWRVPSLPLPELREGDDAPPVAALARNEAVRLFVDRALLVQPAFAVTPHNAAAVAQVCARLDGIPLALELAAARVRVLTVEQIAARLDDRFQLLTGGSRTALPRQQTLQAAVAWSFGLLDEQERALLRRLSAFAGGCTLDAAEAVCAGGAVDPPDVLDLLTHLVDKSLVQSEPAGDAVRYRLLETIRLYGRERLLEAAEAAAVWDRHRAWCAALVARYWEERNAGRAGSLLDQVAGEDANLRAALEWCLETDPAAALPLARHAGMAWQRRGRQQEAVKWLDAALARGSPSSALPAERAEALTLAGRFYREMGDVAAARARLDAARAVFAVLGARSREDQLLVEYAFCAVAEGDAPRAVPLLEEALARCRAAGDVGETVNRLRDLGVVALGTGDLGRARALLTESIALARATGGTTGHALARLGLIARLEGDLPQARALLGESLAAVRAEGFRVGMVTALGGLGSVARAEGDLPRARACYREILDAGRRNGYDLGCPFGLCHFAFLAAAEGDPARAARLLGAVTEQARALLRMHRPDVEAEVATTLARARVALGDPAFDRAWQDGRALGLPQAVADALEENPDTA